MDELSPFAQVVVRDSPDATRTGDWQVVLAAAGIPYRTVRTDTGWGIAVAESDRAPAVAALDGYDADTIVPVEGALPDSRPSVLGVVTALTLVAFYAATGPWEARPPSAWFAAGGAVSAQILAGQWWRTVTALTLHGDVMHLFGNAVASVIFVGAAGRWLGSGVGALTMLSAAAVGNALTALYHGPGHRSVGASTATFAALGILAGLQLVRRWRFGRLRRRAWLPIGAGLALFAMLGVSPHADIAAHGFGLGMGCLLGLGAALLHVGRPRALIQIAAAVASAGLLAASWLLAFARA